MNFRLLTKINASLVPVFSLVLLLLAAWPAEAAELDDTIALCVSCHGEKGMPVEPDMPILWGQEFYYIYRVSAPKSPRMNDVSTVMVTTSSTLASASIIAVIEPAPEDDTSV